VKLLSSPTEHRSRPFPVPPHATYRAVMNVHQLDADGHPVQQWCFAPEGCLATGDVLLAQKIALETMETKALAIANSQTFRM
jgi:hypothetical protein